MEEEVKGKIICFVGLMGFYMIDFNYPDFIYLWIYFLRKAQLLHRCMFVKVYSMTDYHNKNKLDNIVLVLEFKKNKNKTRDPEVSRKSIKA